MTTVTYAPSHAAGFGAFGPEQLGLTMQAQAGAPYPFAGGHFAGPAPFGGVAPLSTIPQLYGGPQPNGAPQQYPNIHAFSYPQFTGTSQGWNAQAGAISPAAVLGAVVWLQQHIAQQLATLVAQSGPWSAMTQPAFQPQQAMFQPQQGIFQPQQTMFQPQQSVPGMAFGGGGQFGRPGFASY
jgi:hypothetical protein